MTSGRGGQPIGLYSHQKARAEILRQAKELVDVALAVGHMQAALWRAHERYRLARTEDPKDAIEHATVIHPQIKAQI
ncbi:hypothetical protein [Bradyrhizobium canariense]|uniref:hypothetical protein n=1 Tax=Bradyrhizobium canariense TaxID=255045 RepID=UPI001CA4BBF8|nr:hypothetical protein [Bradyrhizobium canariense]